MERLTARILGPQEHSIHNELIDRNALKVIHELSVAGFHAYIVGGGVRDLLLGMEPKDFDVVTDATPEQIDNIIRRSRIIGRRFRLVHARFGREIIEVATFRALNDNSTDIDSGNGMILNDNVYGDIEQDAERRDFTINALYYDPENRNIHDYVGGLEDLEKRQLRVIGDPGKRFIEDPARMLRLARLKAKLDLSIEQETYAALHKHAHLLTSISSARMFDEVNKVFLSGHARQSLAVLQELELFGILFPVTQAPMKELPWAQPMLEQACQNTDVRVQAGKPVTPAFLFAVILWPATCVKFERIKSEGLPPINAMIKAASQVFSKQLPITSIPKRHTTSIREIWELQLRLPKRGGKRAERTVAHPRFRAAYDFLLIREASGELPVPADKNGLGEWWTRYQEAAPAERNKMTKKLGGKPQGRRRRR